MFRIILGSHQVLKGRQVFFSITSLLDIEGEILRPLASKENIIIFRAYRRFES